VAQVKGIAARRQQDVRLPDHGHPALFIDAGQRRQLQHADGFPGLRTSGLSFRVESDNLPITSFQVEKKK
jgi:hypothetical protein